MSIANNENYSSQPPASDARSASAKSAVLRQLQIIPGVGKSIARDLYALGIRRVSDLRGKDPEKLYRASNRLAGVSQDRCLLYVFRCAVYFASAREHNPEKLLWWNWKDVQQANQKERRRLNPTH